VSTDIILIGPMGVGKSTLGKLLADHLGLPQCSMDTVSLDYYKEIGYSEETEQQIERTEGIAGRFRYWKPFEAHAVERLLAEHQGYVIDFGAGHSVFEDAGLFARVQRALAPYPNVVLILPSADVDESIRVLAARSGMEDVPFYNTLNAHFITHPANYGLAKNIVYTQDKTPEQTRDEILAAITMSG
jgi:shikimate kinase